jgi:hypothetical protein
MVVLATTTKTGLKVYARFDQSEYPKKLKVTDQQLADINIARRNWHPEWNYVIAPRQHAGPDP